MKRAHIVISVPRLIAGLLAIALVGLVSWQHLSTSEAASIPGIPYNHNPLGLIDSCHLSGSTTVLVGWAYDPDAPVGAQPYVNVTAGGQTVNVATAVAGYHDAGIDQYITQHDYNAPTNSVYGWTAAFNGLYKGRTYTVGGSVLNYGAGTNTTLSVYPGSPDQTPFTGTTIPSACLANVPVAAPTPAPTPTTSLPISTPSPVRTTPITSGGATKVVSPKATTPVTPAATTPVTPGGPANDANAVATTGTNTVSIIVPAGGATKVHLIYTLPNGKTVTTEDQPVSGSSAIIRLNGLDARSDFIYQIVRTTGNGVSSTSPSANFSTQGYAIRLTFTDDHKRPVSGITASITDQRSANVTSDEHGQLTFSGLPAGNYTVAYTYKGAAYTKDFQTAGSAKPGNDATNPSVVTLDDAINVDKLAVGSGSAQSGHGGWLLLVIIGIGLVGIFGGGLWSLLSRIRRRRLQAEYQALGNEAMQDVLTQPAYLPAAPAPNLQGGASHAGESLRDMVLESMRAQTGPVSAAPLTPQATPQPLGQPPQLPLPPAVTPYQPIVPAAPTNLVPTTPQTSGTIQIPRSR